jgi:hypothetical protein
VGAPRQELRVHPHGILLFWRSLIHLELEPPSERVVPRHDGTGSRAAGHNTLAEADCRSQTDSSR